MAAGQRECTDRTQIAAIFPLNGYGAEYHVVIPIFVSMEFDQYLNNKIHRTINLDNIRVLLYFRNLVTL